MLSALPAVPSLSAGGLPAAGGLSTGGGISAAAGGETGSGRVSAGSLGISCASDPLPKVSDPAEPPLGVEVAGSGIVVSCGLPLPPEEDRSLDGTVPDDAEAGTFAPARSASSCFFVIQVEVPVSSETQSSLVWTRFAKKSPMPLAALASQLVICVKREWRNPVAYPSIGGVELASVCSVLDALPPNPRRVEIAFIMPPTKSNGPLAMVGLLVLLEAEAEVRRFWNAPGPRSPSAMELMSIP